MQLAVVRCVPSKLNRKGELSPRPCTTQSSQDYFGHAHRDIERQHRKLLEEGEGNGLDRQTQLIHPLPWTQVSTWIE